MKKVDLAYIAGIIDGEGCVAIERAKYAEGKYKRIVSLSVTNTEEWICQWLKFCWGGRVTPQQPRKKNYLPQWNWVIRRAKATEVLEAILPYLKLKKQQAEVAISFQARRHIWAKTDREKTLDEAEYILIKDLKKQRT